MLFLFNTVSLIICKTDGKVETTHQFIISIQGYLWIRVFSATILKGWKHQEATSENLYRLQTKKYMLFISAGSKVTWYDADKINQMMATFDLVSKK